MYAVNLKLIARGNWRNVGLIDYQIGIKREIINKYPSTNILSPTQADSETSAVTLHLSAKHVLGIIVTYK